MPHLGHIIAEAIVDVVVDVRVGITALDVKVLVVAVTSLLSQAWMPSVQVWSKFNSPSCPQLLNQAPSRAQQLRLPDCFTMPHFGHMIAEAIVDVVVVDVRVDTNALDVKVVVVVMSLLSQASMPSAHV